MPRILTASALFLALAIASSCTRTVPDPSDRSGAVTPGDTVKSHPPIQDVLARQTPSLMTIQGVTGTGEGEAGGKSVIVVYTSHISRENRDAIPREIEGYGVEIRDIGDVTAPPH